MAVYNAFADRVPVYIILSNILDATWRRIDYATLAKAYGVHGIGPVERPGDLGPALKRAVEIVRRGESALVDVVTRNQEAGNPCGPARR